MRRIRRAVSVGVSLALFGFMLSVACFVSWAHFTGQLDNAFMVVTTWTSFVVAVVMHVRR